MAPGSDPGRPTGQRAMLATTARSIAPAARGSDGSVGPEDGDVLGEALRLMASTPRAVAPMVRAVAPAVLERRPTPEEWSPREVLGHLLYVEGLLRVRLAAMVAGPDGSPMPTGVPAPEPGPALDSLSAWQRRRTANLRWLNTLDAAQLDRAAIHRRWGRITVREHVVEWSYHDLDHARQLLASLEAELYPSIGEWRGLYPAPFPPPEGVRPTA